MRDNAYDGKYWADFTLVCEEKNNDRNYYEKWFAENGLKYEYQLYNQIDKCNEMNCYIFNVRWKYK